MRTFQWKREESFFAKMGRSETGANVWHLRTSFMFSSTIISLYQGVSSLLSIIDANGCFNSPIVHFTLSQDSGITTFCFASNRLVLKCGVFGRYFDVRVLKSASNEQWSRNWWGSRPVNVICKHCDANACCLRKCHSSVLNCLVIYRNILSSMI